MGNTFKLGNYVNGIFQDASNNIGIGGSPSGSYKLEVTGTAKVSSTLLVSGVATFSSSVTAGGYITGQGTNPGGLGGSRYVLDWLSGSMRIFSYGADASTNGGFVFNSQRSDGTNSFNSMTITGAGNVGIGTSSPGALLHIYDSTAGSTKTYTKYSALEGGDIRIGKQDGINNNAIFGTWSNNDVQLYANSVERMRITSGGNIEIANASSFLQWIGGSYWTFRTVTSGTEFWLYRGDTGATPLIVTSGNIVRLSSLAGSGSRTVTADASGNLSASSDSSLKQEDASHKIEGLDEILKLKPRAYKWLSDIEIRGEDATTEIGFFANEVNAIIPSAAPKGNDDLYGFYDRAVIAALVKAIQEQQVQIQNLQEQNQDLKSRLDKAGL